MWSTKKVKSKLFLCRWSKHHWVLDMFPLFLMVPKRKCSRIFFVKVVEKKNECFEGSGFGMFFGGSGGFFGRFFGGSGGSKHKTKNNKGFPHPWAQIWIKSKIHSLKLDVYIFLKNACITSDLCIIPDLIKTTYLRTAMHICIYRFWKKVFWQPALPAWAMPLAGRAMPDWVVGCELGSRMWPKLGFFKFMYWHIGLVNFFPISVWYS